MSFALSHATRHSLALKLAKQKETTEAMVGQGFQLAEVAGAAFAAGYVNQKFGTNGEMLFQGVPADLLAGLGLHLLSFAGMAGKFDEHLHNLGDGMIASYATRAGMHLAAAATTAK